ncbi:MAG: zinc-ribbon and DUF3426 domain-containing protein [Pseudomonadota bacterium]
MSLATRCTACGTIFRVVQDQLKVSEGWVRCGRCQEVFNALQNLFDLEREAPPPWPPAQAPAPQPEPVAAAADEGIATDDETPSDPANLSTQPLLHTASRDFPPDEEGAEPEDTGFEDARFNEELLSDEGLLEQEPQEEDKGLEVFGASQLEPMPSFKSYAKTSAAKAAAKEAPDDEAPRFLREAERAARWQHPAVRVTLLLLAALGSALLAAQVGLHWRAEFAAHWPESRLVLGPLCAALDCQIGPPRRLESLAVDASGLTQLETPGQYRLSVVLRNRGRAAVMLPAVELSLTDAQGRLVARRALAPGELGARQDSLAAGSELPLQAAFSVGDLRVVGYTVEIFYP